MINLHDFQRQSGYNETRALQAAVDAAGTAQELLRVPAGNYFIDRVDIRRPVRIEGEGLGTRFSCKAKSSLPGMFSVSHKGSLDLSHACVDGANHYADSGFEGQKEASIHCNVEGGSVTLNHVSFTGGRTFDVRMIGHGRIPSRLTIDQCQFLGGAESTYDYRCDGVRIHGRVITNITNSIFDGVVTTGFGRSGILCQVLAGQDPTERGMLYVAGCTLINRGYNRKHTVGAIDAYSGMDFVRIVNNVILHPRGRGIGVKADTTHALVSGNQISGLTGEHATGCIAMFGSKLDSVGGMRIVADNTMTTTDPWSHGIIVDGSDLEDTKKVTGTCLRHNQISLAGPVEGVEYEKGQLGGTGILFKYVDGAMVLHNRIRGGWVSMNFAQGNEGEIHMLGNKMLDSRHRPVRIKKGQDFDLDGGR